MAVLNNILGQIGGYTKADPLGEALKYSTIGKKLARDKFRLPQLRQAIDSGDQNAIRQQYMQYDPSSVPSMMIKPTSSGRPSVFEQRLQAGQTPEVQAILEQYDVITKEAVDKITADPYANITPELQQASMLESKFKTLAGTPMANKLTVALVRQMANERKFAEQNEDDTFASVNEVIKESMKTVSDDARQLAAATPELRKAIDLMVAGIPAKDQEGAELNPNAINSAIKVYVKSLDNSAVMQGEIAQIAGDSFLGRVKGWINGAFTGVEMSANQLKNFWDSLKIVVEAHNNAVDEIVNITKKTASKRIDGLISLKRLNPGEESTYTTQIDDILKATTAKYKVTIPDKNMNFQDVVFGELSNDGETKKFKKPATTGGGTFGGF